MDRVHRVGQTRPVRVVRFVTRKTVEERVTALQRKKTAMITAAMQQQISPQDLQDLFRDPVLS
jgi:SNF2 family DNA or RNA helicase